MKYDCEIVRDLLPLYADQLCSKASRDMIEAHLVECADCKKIALKTQDSWIEDTLNDEKEEILYKHQKTVKRKTVTVGMAMAGVLLIPVIISLICNLAAQRALNWFFIVLTAMLLVASLLVVPLVVNSNRFFWTVLSATASLLLLLLTCCIYTHGRWFLVAAAGCILGLSIVFAPFMINIALATKLKNHKAMLVLAWDSLWLYLLLIACGFFIRAGRQYWQDSMVITTYILLIIWFWGLVLSYLKKNRWIKAGLLVAVSGFWFGMTNDILNFFMASKSENGMRYLNLKKGFFTTNWQVLNANIMFTVMLVSAGIGLIWLWIGIREEKKDDWKKKDETRNAHKHD